MKWFRHSANGSKSKALSEAVALYKAQAYMLYFVTLEVIAEEQERGSIVGECEVVMNDYLARVKCSKKIATKILSFFQERGDLLFEVRGARIWLKDPNFWDRVDEYTKRRATGIKPDRRRKKRIQGGIELPSAEGDEGERQEPDGS